MRKLLSLLLVCLLAVSAVCAAPAAFAAGSAPTGFTCSNSLLAHAVSGSDDGEAWLAWQSVHDEDFNIKDSSVKYFFLPTGNDGGRVDIYNAYSKIVTLDGTELKPGEASQISYETGKEYKVNADDKSYTLRFMKSNAEAAIFVNNSNADGNGNDLMSYLNVDKSRSAKATGAIVTPDGKIDNTSIKKIKGRGNTTWGKAKKAYNITYDSKVSIAGMTKSKKYSILANYQDDSLSRNRFLYDLSDAVGMPYASDSRYVDFYVNGFYWGSYQMTEKIEVGSSSVVSDFEEEDYLDENGGVKADFPFLCEVDAGAQDGEDYYVTISNGIKITIKAPELEPGDKGYDEVKAYVKEKFGAFYTAAQSRTADLSAYADVDSLANLYLINELGKNWDSGVSSTFFTYRQDENGNYKVYGSPVWDYDNSLGNAKGVENDLRNMGVSDYRAYTGWWCRYKGKSSNQKSSSNIINRLSQNTNVTAAAQKLWFGKYVPAIDHFTGKAPDENINKDFYTADAYYNLIRDSAEMNYTSGWLLKTSDGWIANHTSLKKASYDDAAKTYTLNKTATRYANTFEGMYNYCRDWMVSRAAWLSKEMSAELVTEVEADSSPKTVSSYALSKTVYTYSGKAKRPSVTIKDVDGNVVNASNYTVEYSAGRKNVGTYTVTVTMQNGYTGTCTLEFRINPAGVKLKSVTPAKKGFTAKWAKSTKQTTGYQLQYAKGSGFKNAVKKTIKSAKTAKLTVKKLKAKKYCVRIRAYKTSGSKKYYSAWSKTKTVKVK